MVLNSRFLNEKYQNNLCGMKCKRNYFFKMKIKEINENK